MTTIMNKLKVTPKLLKIGELADDLPTMSAYDVIQAVAGHLMAMDAPCRVPDNSDLPELCVYNGANGACCAAAPFIKDYTSDMEGNSWRELLSGFTGQSESLCELIGELQKVHDGDIFWEESTDEKKLGYIVESIGELDSRYDTDNLMLELIQDRTSS